ncbi:uncharacterized protein LOC113238787 [Hyposmocoma kahamanoa]|uniref:uncharacterized protein LOC113238787 n=1 Tax=Hyposmocoma kahamanoa TaxID=1477025 RepID=UPI000E6D8B5B|nr:uncharacterized protein LOC113238787 [Hyposmocoma kahamanoa]
MQAIANSIGNRKRRYTPEILKLHRILRKMQSALGFTINSPKKPTRTTRNTHQETTTDKKALKAVDLDFLEWKWNRRRTPISRAHPKRRSRRKGSENHQSTYTFYTATSEIESATAAVTTVDAQTEVLKSETVVKFGRKFLKVIKMIKEH